LIGLALTAAGALISYDSVRRLASRPAAGAYVVWPLVVSLLAKVALASVKFHYGRKLRSDALTATHGTTPWIPFPPWRADRGGPDALDPLHFFNADRYGASW